MVKVERIVVFVVVVLVVVVVVVALVVVVVFAAVVGLRSPHMSPPRTIMIVTGSRGGMKNLHEAQGL